MRLYDWLSPYRNLGDDDSVVGLEFWPEDSIAPETEAVYTELVSLLRQRQGVRDDPFDDDTQTLAGSLKLLPSGHHTYILSGDGEFQGNFTSGFEYPMHLQLKVVNPNDEDCTSLGPEDVKEKMRIDYPNHRLRAFIDNLPVIEFRPGFE